MAADRLDNNRWGWRQPIPSSTALGKIFGDDNRCMNLFIQLIYRANNTEGATFPVKVGKFGTKSITLQRGQVLFGRKKFSDYLCWTESSTERALKKLMDVYKVVNMVKETFYTVVTIQSYEEIIDMNRVVNMESNKARTGREQGVNTSKSDTKSEDSKNETKHTNVATPVADKALEISSKDGIQPLIGKFYLVNPNFQRLYANKSERAALDRMIKEHGSEKIERVIDSLSETNKLQYAPIITTPCELERGMGKLIAFLNRQKKSTATVAVMPKEVTYE